MSNLEKMKKVADLVGSRKLSKKELDAVMRAVAKETGFTVAEVKQVLGASVLMFGKE